MHFGLCSLSLVSLTYLDIVSLTLKAILLLLVSVGASFQFYFIHVFAEATPTGSKPLFFPT